VLIVPPAWSRGWWVVRRPSALLRLRWHAPDSTRCAMPGQPHGSV